MDDKKMRWRRSPCRRGRGGGGGRILLIFWGMGFSCKLDVSWFDVEHHHYNSIGWFDGAYLLSLLKEGVMGTRVDPLCMYICIVWWVGCGCREEW